MGFTPIDEVVRQHVFIEAWLDGRAGDEDWGSFDRALAPSFSMVIPEGVATAREDLVGGFRQAKGSVPGLRVEIRNAVVVDRSDERVSVRYEEWQTSPDGANQRVSLAVFKPDDRAPIGWAWQCLHETWLPSPT